MRCASPLALSPVCLLPRTLTHTRPRHDVPCRCRRRRPSLALPEPKSLCICPSPPTHTRTSVGAASLQHCITRRAGTPTLHRHEREHARAPHARRPALPPRSSPCAAAASAFPPAGPCPPPSCPGLRSDGRKPKPRPPEAPSLSVCAQRRPCVLRPLPLQTTLTRPPDAPHADARGCMCICARLLARSASLSLSLSKRPPRRLRSASARAEDKCCTRAPPPALVATTPRCCCCCSTHSACLHAMPAWRRTHTLGGACCVLGELLPYTPLGHPCCCTTL